MPQADKDPCWLLARWLRRALVNIHNHNLAERYFSWRSTTLDVVTLMPLVVLGVVASINDLTTTRGRILALGLALAGALLAVLQQTLKYGEKASQHQMAARLHAQVRRTIEQANDALENSERRSWLIEEARRSWDVAASLAPNAPQRLRNQAKRLVDDGRQPASWARWGVVILVSGAAGGAGGLLASLL